MYHVRNDNNNYYNGTIYHDVVVTMQSRIRITTVSDTHSVLCCILWRTRQNINLLALALMYIIIISYSMPIRGVSCMNTLTQAVTITPEGIARLINGYC